MPQMAPINWMSLLISIVIVFLVFNSMNYFSFLYHPSSKQINKKKNLINWKW
uniref:ATP synthase complex subunit 8 n=1 Tax=Staphylinoidea sp. 5 KM-2017 TaxID=2219459 RepID=A0A346RIM6_9COLE|nr:ATP synthase F0 subunit 8 [Staphylinoidea sp. 5 KM-2017]